MDPVGRIVALLEALARGGRGKLARVEKSYFDSKVLAPASVEALLSEGLEQARDTRLPEVLVRARFRPCIEDEMGALFPAGTRLVAHPGGPVVMPARGRVVLAIGP